MRILFNRALLLPVSDLIRGRNLEQAMRMLRESQDWSLEKLKNYQLHRLNDILSSSYRNVPYYRELINEHLKGNPKMQNLGDLAKLPLLTKDKLRSHYPDKITMNPLPNKGWRYHKTGGSTTGEPLVTIEDDEASDIGRAAFYRAWHWMGWEPGAPALKIWGRPIEKQSPYDKLVKKLSEYYMNMPVFNAFQMDNVLFEKIANNIKSRSVQFVYGYATAIDEFAKYAINHNLSFPSLQGVLSTAEVLYPHMRERIIRAFSAPLFNGYACGEVNGVAYQKEPDDNDLHIAMERAVVEIVDEKGNVLPDGEPGMIALTDLHKKVMPLIRYVPGDEGVIRSQSREGKSTNPRLTKILGRTCDIIEGVNGKNVHSYFFARFFSNLNWAPYGLNRFQILQKTADSLDIYLEIEEVPPINEIHRLKSELENYFGSMKFKIHWNKGLVVSSSGKLRWTINKMREDKLKQES